MIGQNQVCSLDVYFDVDHIHPHCFIEFEDCVVNWTNRHSLYLLIIVLLIELETEQLDASDQIKI